MRPAQAHSDSPRALRRRLDCLTGLPLRPDTARSVLQRFDTSEDGWPEATRERIEAIDPGWALPSLRLGRAFDPLEMPQRRGLVAE